ncbi:MAG TPA: hypothetical protein VIC62_03675 [Nakamurella sp.]
MTMLITIVGRLQVEMKAQGIVDLGHDGGLQLTKGGPKSLDRDRMDLFGLGLRCDAQAAGLGRYQHLERKDSRRVAGQRHDRDHTSPKSFGGGIGSIVADHDGRTPLVGLATPDGVEIHESDLPAAHQVHPSVAAASHAARSPEPSQSSQAAA